MKTMKTLVLTLTFLFISTAAFAQVATPNRQLAWDQTNVANAAEAQSFTYKYYPDGAAVGIALTGVTCTGTTTVTCTVPFPAFTPGQHTLTLTASNVAGESAKSAVFSFSFEVVPTAPSNLRLVSAGAAGVISIGSNQGSLMLTAGR